MYEPVAPSTPMTANRPASLVDPPLAPPQPGFRDSVADNRDSVNSELLSSTPYRDDPSARGSEAALHADKEGVGYPPASPDYGSPSGGKKKRPLWILILIGLAALVAIVLAVILPVYFKVIRKDDSSSSSSSHAPSTTNHSPTHTTDHGPATTTTAAPTAPTSGGDGSTVTMEDGTTFIYKNSFGGYWVDDPNDPFNMGARPQSWSPALNESWNWGVDVIRGVNLGGWLVLEPFISPALYQPYENSSTPATDEWTLSENMAKDTARGGLAAIMEEHYKTFITEEDFAAIAAAGLNWIRLPIPFWAIDKFPDEPFLEGVAWKYALKAFKWARKYGLRINLDLHTIPGSQNGYNHSGKGGQINFLMGSMGIANAQRTLNYIRVFTEFISQPEYKDLIPMFGVINEARTADIGMPAITSFYLQMYDMMRKITGVGAGKGPYISVHDGFAPLANWSDFLPGGDRLALDSHTYFCFGNLDVSPLAQQLTRPCNAWGSEMRTSTTNFGVTTAGEFSLAINDCGLYLNGVGSGTRFEGTHTGYSGPKGTTTCEDWTDWTKWTQTRKDELREFALASMDSLQHWFFWTWKIGNSTTSGRVESPLWAYRLGWEQGWIPKDPRESAGKCSGLTPSGPLKPNQIGGAGSDTISASIRSQFAWPPTSIEPGIAVASMPTYTATGTIPTLAVPTVPNPPAGFDGWTSDDHSPAYVPISGCAYPPQWDATGFAAVACPASGAQRRGVRGVISPRATPPPL